MSNETEETIGVANQLESSHLQGSGQGPGEQLRKAREAKGFSVEDIAKKLFLTSTMVKQIEADDYSHQPAVTFMRGYLRSYAKLVDIDAEPLINQFNSFAIEDKPAPMPTQRIYQRETSLFGKSLPWIGGIILVFIILLVVMWVRSDQSGSHQNLNTNSSVNTPSTSSTNGSVATPMTPAQTSKGQAMQQPASIAPLAATAKAKNTVKDQQSTPSLQVQSNKEQVKKSTAKKHKPEQQKIQSPF